MRDVSLCVVAICLSLASSRADAGTLYSTDFSAGLDGKWSIFSSHPNGVVKVGPRGSHAHVLNMNLKGNSSALGVDNAATLTLNMSRWTDIKLSFDHFATLDPANNTFFSTQALILGFDGIGISTDGVNWEVAWETPTTFTDGFLRVDDLDISSIISSHASLATGGKLMLRFQSFVSFGPGGLRSDGRGWDNIALTGVTIPEPSGVVLILIGLGSAAIVFSRRGVCDGVDA